MSVSRTTASIGFCLGLLVAIGVGCSDSDDDHPSSSVGGFAGETGGSAGSADRAITTGGTSVAGFTNSSRTTLAAAAGADLGAGGSDPSNGDASSRAGATSATGAADTGGQSGAPSGAGSLGGTGNLAGAGTGTSLGGAVTGGQSGSPNWAGSATAGASGNANAGAAGQVEPGATTDTPITDLASRSWTWVPVAGAVCRDGSPTGIGVNPNPVSTDLVIFLEGGGACFNPLTCLLNAQAFGASDFTASAAVAGEGIFNRNDGSNPVRDWNFVYVPYCTGDVHAGNNPAGSITGLGIQRFVGYSNLGLFLRRIVPTFNQVTRVLLTGISAGGFGAAANYLRTARAFGSVPVYLLDDSGPLMDSPYIPTCLAQIFAQTWGFDQTILAECGTDCADPAHYFLDLTRHTLTSYPDLTMGLVDSTGDSVISQFFGFGTDNCTAMTALSPSTFAAGLEDLRSELASNANFASFFFAGTDHTSLGQSAALDSRSTAGVKLTDWIAQLLSGRTSHVGP